MSFAYVPLHIHSGYSILDGLSSVESLVKRAAELNLPAISLNDHGSLSGAYKLVQECRRYGITPIVGIEAYVAPSLRTLREPVFWGSSEQRSDDVGGGGKYCHLSIWAQDDEGVSSLLALYADSHKVGFYGKPRVDLESLGRHSHGLIVSTGCVGGPVSTALRLGREDIARKWVGDLRDIFDDRLYVEVMRHGIPVEDEVEPLLIRTAEWAAVPLVATLDAHYASPEQSGVHDALLCVQTKALLSTPKEDRFSFQGDGYYIQSAEEFRQRFVDMPDAVFSTLEILERTSYYVDHFRSAQLLPSFTGTVEGDNYELATRVNDRLAELSRGDAYSDRAGYETEVICSRGFAGYLLVVAHCISEGRKRGIRFGPGRGSGGASLVAYALGITEIDPLVHGLIFERFINPERSGLPDIDIDIDQGRRDEFIALVRELYGEEYVGQICTFGTIGAKSAIRDAARVQGHPVKVGDELVKQLPAARFGRQPSLSELKDDLGQTGIISLATGLEGATRSEGVHAAGIVISPIPLVERVPVRRAAGKGGGIVAYDMSDVEALGFAKTDFLGLANLGVIDECLRLLMVSPGGANGLPTEYTDTETFKLLSAGETSGVFQLDGSGMRGLLRRLRPESLDDIASVLALYRPGPMGANSHIQYADRKNGRSPVDFIHREYESVLESVLLPTHGLIVFQEQVLDILRITGGYTYGSAALIFDAMRKKDRDKLKGARPDFMSRLHSKGYSDEAAEALWDVLVPFADYSFNKSHATGYGIISYWTAYLKVNHTREYFTALLTVESDPDKLHEYIREAVRWGIEVLPPDVNRSEFGWGLRDEGILFGLGSVKGVAKGSFAALSKGRPYTDLRDFFERADKKVLNLSVLTALIESGAMDSLEPNREGLLNSAEALSARALAGREASRSGADRLWTNYNIPPETTNLSQRVTMEQFRLGMAFSVPRLQLTTTRFLEQQEIEYVRRVFETYPGRSDVELWIKERTRLSTGRRVRINDNLVRSLDALGLIVVVEE